MKLIIEISFLLVCVLIINTVVKAQDGCLNGKIYDKESDNPLEGVNITLVESLQNELSIDTTRSTSEGDYSICPKEQGLKNILVWSPGFSPERRTLEMQSDEKRLEFYLIKAGSVKGTIRDTSGRELEGVHIELEYNDTIDFPYLPQLLGGIIDTHKDGVFQIRNIEPLRSSQLTVTHPDYVTFVSEAFSLESGQELSLEITLVRK